MSEMSPAEEVFFAALERYSPIDRAAYLDEACAGRPELRARVEKLLAAHPRVGGFLDSAAHGDATATFRDLAATGSLQPAPAEAEGTVIAGRYKLRQQIGEGGMGTVWMADQTEPVKRKVAVKLIRVERGQSKTILARFEAERQAIALMDHPHIAKLLDAGTTEAGSPFFVMELVRGVPLNDFCDQQKLTIPERLTLFTQVCSAVQHAHQKGVIHRDLKPSNILVESHDGRPVPKVIDFGLAKATTGLQLSEQSMFTAFGSVMGTPAYMAPEQAAFNAVDVDTRVDVYALGVVLYELLTGTTPITRDTLRKVALDEMLRLVREQEAPTPSSRLSSADSTPGVAASRQTEPAKLSRFVKGELDWIVLKAISKERDRRYETASGFARDVERFLAHEPVSAGPPGAAYRVRKFVRRNRPQVIAASLVLLALVAGVIGTTLGMVQANWAADAERIAKDDAVEQKRLADEAAEQERRAKVGEAERAEGERQAKLEAEAKRQEAERNLAFARKGNAILGSVFAGLAPKKIAESGRPLQDVLRENLDQAVRDLDGSAIGDPLEVAAMQNTLGWSLFTLGEYGPASEVLGRAWATRKTRLGPDHADTLQSMNRLALAHLEVARFDRALPLFEEALRLRKAKLGPDHPDTLESMHNLAAGYTMSGRDEKALPLYEETLALKKAKLGPDHPETLATMNNLGMSYRDIDQHDRALALFERTLELRKAKFGPEHPDTLTSLSNLARGYLTAKKLDLARPLVEESLRLHKAGLGPDHPDTLTTMHDLADYYRQARKPESALPLYQELLKLRTARLGPDHPDTVLTLNDIALVYADAGKVGLALTTLEETLSRAKAKLGPDHPSTLTFMQNLAGLYRNAGKHDRELPLAEEGLARRKAKYGPDHRETLHAMDALALAYRDNGKPDRAFPLIEEALERRQARFGPDHPDILQSLNNLADAYRIAGQPAKALPLFETAYERMKATRGPDDPGTLAVMGNLAQAYTNKGQHDKALPLYEERLERTKATRGPDHHETLHPMVILAGGYRAAGQPDKALPLFEEALKRIRATYGPDHPGFLACANGLVKCYQAARKPDLAVPLLAEVRDRATAKHGPDHPVTLRSMYNLAEGYQAAGQLNKALPLLEDTLTLTKAKLGPNHLETLRCLGNLGEGYWYAGRVAEALPLLEEAYRASKKNPALQLFGIHLLDAYVKAGKPTEARKLIDELLADARKTLPRDSPQLTGQMARYGMVLMELKAFADAEPFLRECLAVREAKEPDAWRTFNTHSMLGGALLGQKKYAEAEPLLLKGYEGLKAREKTIPPPAATRIPEALDRLIELYTATGKPDEAATWRAKYPAPKEVAPPPREKK